MLADVTTSRLTRRALWSSVLALFVGSTFDYGVLAQQPRPVSSLRMYVIDMGGRPPGPRESTYPSFLVVHPKGTLLWEAGALPDALVGTGLAERQHLREPLQTIVTPKPLKERLAEIGYKPSDITLLALSHYHGDHTGNANMFVGSTWLVQRAERDTMFSEKPARSMDRETYSALNAAKTIVIENKDHDVFGDGTVIIKFVPGHTEGQQALFVKLAKQGPVVISSDLYHSTDEHVTPITMDHVPMGEVSREQTLASRISLEEFLTKTGAALWIQHDVPTIKRLKKSPEYYE